MKVRSATVHFQNFLVSNMLAIDRHRPRRAAPRPGTSPVQIISRLFFAPYHAYRDRDFSTGTHPRIASFRQVFPAWRYAHRGDHLPNCNAFATGKLGPGISIHGLVFVRSGTGPGLPSSFGDTQPLSSRCGPGGFAGSLNILRLTKLSRTIPRRGGREGRCAYPGSRRLRHLQGAGKKAATRGEGFVRDR